MFDEKLPRWRMCGFCDGNPKNTIDGDRLHEFKHVFFAKNR